MPVDKLFEGPARVEPVSHAIRGVAHYLIGWAGNQLAVEQGEYPFVTAATIQAVHTAIERWWQEHESIFWEYFTAATGDADELQSDAIHHPLTAVLYALVSIYLADVDDDEARELMADPERTRRRAAEAAFAFINDSNVRNDYYDLLMLIKQIVLAYGQI